MRLKSLSLFHNKTLHGVFSLLGKKTKTVSLKDIFSSKYRNVFVFNIALCSIFFALFVFYIMSANNITAHNYQVRVLQGKLGTIEKIHSGLIEQQVSYNSYFALLRFAKEQNMVKAQDIQYLFGNRGVALQK